MTKPKTKKRNRRAQDATLINIQSLKKRVKHLEECVQELYFLRATKIIGGSQEDFGSGEYNPRRKK